MDAPEQVDLNGDVPGLARKDLFRSDARQSARKQRPCQKANPTQRLRPVGSSASGPNSGSNGAGASSETGRPPKGFRAQDEKDAHYAVGGCL
ncbi:hypothetical protein Tco_0489016 [Tanacetum coccineum]